MPEHGAATLSGLLVTIWRNSTRFHRHQPQTTMPSVGERSAESTASMSVLRSYRQHCNKKVGRCRICRFRSPWNVCAIVRRSDTHRSPNQRRTIAARCVQSHRAPLRIALELGSHALTQQRPYLVANDPRYPRSANTEGGGDFITRQTISQHSRHHGAAPEHSGPPKQCVNFVSLVDGSNPRLGLMLR